MPIFTKQLSRCHTASKGYLVTNTLASHPLNFDIRIEQAAVGRIQGTPNGAFPRSVVTSDNSDSTDIDFGFGNLANVFQSNSHYSLPALCCSRLCCLIIA